VSHWKTEYLSKIKGSRSYFTAMCYNLVRSRFLDRIA